MNASTVEQGISDRLARLDRMTSDLLQNESPAQRDRRVQRDMAKATSVRIRLERVGQLTDFIIAAQRANRGEIQ
ncbi:MAG TPA: hypothetical protein VJZ71_21005 [Phycisphaerae bacterium]|nr:hypothetical protein [Phycisphaerae bacterium]